jgi:hypothetical protein
MVLFTLSEDAGAFEVIEFAEACRAFVNDDLGDVEVVLLSPFSYRR